MRYGRHMMYAKIQQVEIRPARIARPGATRQFFLKCMNVWPASLTLRSLDNDYCTSHKPGTNMTSGTTLDGAWVLTTLQPHLVSLLRSSP